MLGVDERGDPARSLGFGDGVQRERCLRSTRPKNFDDATTGTADAERFVDGQADGRMTATGFHRVLRRAA